MAQDALDRLWANRSGVLSTQVLQELYVVVTRKFTPPMTRPEACVLVAVYAAWPCVQVDPTPILGASDLEERYQLSF